MWENRKSVKCPPQVHAVKMWSPVLHYWDVVEPLRCGVQRDTFRSLWRHALEEDGGTTALLLPLFHFPDRQWAVVPHHALHHDALTTSPKRANWSRSETSKTVSQNKPFLSWLFQVFVIVIESCLTQFQQPKWLVKQCNIRKAVLNRFRITDLWEHDVIETLLPRKIHTKILHILSVGF